MSHRGAPLLELVNVTRRFPGVMALDGVCFDLRAGEVHALVGENGAGKSTLINIISGVLPPDAGEVRLDGEPTWLANPVAARRRGIVTVHQEAELFSSLSVAENMALARGLPRRRFGLVDWRHVYADARTVVAALGEPLDVRRPAGELSVAARHLTQVAAALAHQAQVLVLDEPTSCLSAAETEWLFRHIRALKSAGVGVLYISHRQDEVFELADRITVLRDGRRVWSGPKQATDRAMLVEAMVGRATSSARADSPSPSRRPTARHVRLEVVALADREGRFRDVSLAVHSGEVLGIYGLVGAGRSELAQTLFGLARSTQGTIRVDGRPCQIRSTADAVQAGIAYVPEDRLREGLCHGLSVRANMVLASLARWGRGPLASAAAERAAAAREAEALAIRRRSIEQPVRQLSGGNQQKVVLARWLLTEPKVLLLDEPTRGVDVGAKAEIHRLLRRFADQGAAVVLISSDLPEILENSDRVLVFREGRISGEFDPRGSQAVEIAAAALPHAAAGPRWAGGRPSTRPRRRWPSGELGLVLAIGMLAIALGTTTPHFFSRDSLLTLLTDVSVWSILAFAAAAVIIAGGIDISIGALMGLAAAACGLILKAHYPLALTFPLAVAAALGVGLAGGMLNAATALVGRVHPIVVTLGTMTVFRGLLIMLTGGDAITELPPAFTRLVNVRVAGLSGSLIVLLAVVVGVHLWLAHTVGGRHLFALGASPAAARLAGISRARAWLAAFGGGGLLTAIAGVLELAQAGSAQSVMGTGYELRAIAAAVIGGTAITGGRGSTIGVLLGALLLSLVHTSLVVWQISRFYYGLVVGALILAAVLWDLLFRKLQR